MINDLQQIFYYHLLPQVSEEPEEGAKPTLFLNSNRALANVRLEMSNFPALVHTLHCIHCVSKKFISQVLYEVKWSFWLCSLWWKLHVFEVEYMQYPIVRNGDQRWALEFLKKCQFLDADSSSLSIVCFLAVFLNLAKNKANETQFNTKCWPFKNENKEKIEITYIARFLALKIWELTVS